MKSKKIKLLVIYLLLLPLWVVIPGSGCNEVEEFDEYADYIVGYVVGSFIGDEVNTEGQATGNKTERGYCILLEGNEEKLMDFYTFNLPDTLFEFSEEILLSTHDMNDCGPVFFSDSLRSVYKIRFMYQIKDEQDKVEFVIGPCLTMVAPFFWEFYDEIYFNAVVH